MGNSPIIPHQYPDICDLIWARASHFPIYLSGISNASFPESARPKHRFGKNNESADSDAVKKTLGIQECTHLKRSIW